MCFKLAAFRHIHAFLPLFDRYIFPPTPLGRAGFVSSDIKALLRGYLLWILLVFTDWRGLRLPGSGFFCVHFPLAFLIASSYSSSLHTRPHRVSLAFFSTHTLTKTRNVPGFYLSAKVTVIASPVPPVTPFILSRRLSLFSPANDVWRSQLSPWFVPKSK